MHVGVGVILAFRIQDGYRRRQHLVRYVVVADDEVDAFLFCVGHFVDGLYAAVEDDDELHACLGGIVHALVRDAISLVVSVGDGVVDVGVVLLNEFID